MLEIVEGYNFIIKVDLNPQEEDSFGVINPFIVVVVVVVVEVGVEVIKVVIVGVVATMGVVNVVAKVVVVVGVVGVKFHHAFPPLPSIL